MPFSAAEGEKKAQKKKVRKSIGDPVRGRDAPMPNDIVSVGILLDAEHVDSDPKYVIISNIFSSHAIDNSDRAHPRKGLKVVSLITAHGQG